MYGSRLDHLADLRADLQAAQAELRELEAAMPYRWCDVTPEMNRALVNARAHAHNLECQMVSYERRG